MKVRTEDQWYYVRRMLVDIDLPTRRMVPICHTHPIRVELQIEEHGRLLFEDIWDTNSPVAMPVESFPMAVFIDGFGVFRNSYRTLMGMYFTPAALTLDERRRPRSIFPLVLGPHASKFGDVIKGLPSLTELDKGMEMEVNGSNRMVCGFPYGNRVRHASASRELRLQGCQLGEVLPLLLCRQRYEDRQSGDHA